MFFIMYSTLHECTPLSSRTPHAIKINYILLTESITKMGQNVINIFSWVDIHGIYYIVRKSVTKFDDVFL